MTCSSEGAGVLTRFGAPRRRMNMKRTLATIVLALAALVILQDPIARSHKPPWCKSIRIERMEIDRCSTCSIEWGVLA